MRPPHVRRGAYLSRGVGSVRPVLRRAPSYGHARRRTAAGTIRSGGIRALQSAWPCCRVTSRTDLETRRAGATSTSRGPSCDRFQGECPDRDNLRDSNPRPYGPTKAWMTGVEPVASGRWSGALPLSYTPGLTNVGSDAMHGTREADRETRRRAPLARWFISCVRGRCPPRGYDLLLYSPLTPVLWCPLEESNLRLHCVRVALCR